ncbi:DUF1127 domain-containing protein [Methyloversatilis discipulorum]|uniref:DUF1127 domain-containing protein n=1 Tax=Methyloversatilis discipulorum TaxID=1119528 RepID=UPI001A3C0BCE|nr:DUF1127 domain-containing protein [Methyloversatilis discipulorum]MBL8467529.1 DUF1127 domain-containing protein [Methyloversatilis discipulorum]
MSAHAWLSEVARRLREARRQRRARAELRAMNDLELRDLGLGRSDLPSVLGGRFEDGFRAQAKRLH